MKQSESGIRSLSDNTGVINIDKSTVDQTSYSDQHQSSALLAPFHKDPLMTVVSSRKGQSVFYVMLSSWLRDAYQT